jgi:peptidoglycan/xylan/chitin deacetylase (PgdA/CDA1 family)
MARPLALPEWPEGAEAAVSLTFDVDAESYWLAEGPEYAGRLTTLSEARYGVDRGLPRLLGLLADEGIRATFYVPGDTAARHPGAVRELVLAGHEVGHHGHLHLRSDRVDARRQREEVERGLDALAGVGARPEGYRSPSWELTPETLALLLEHGFAWDSSCMGDDRPYLEEHDGLAILELPVHWSLDDWPFFGWTPDAGGQLADPGLVAAAWLEEIASACAERRHLTLTMHPEVIGRPHRLAALRRLLRDARATGRLWFAAHGEVAARVAAANLP